MVHSCSSEVSTRRGIGLKMNISDQVDAKKLKNLPPSYSRWGWILLITGLLTYHYFFCDQFETCVIRTDNDTDICCDSRCRGTLLGRDRIHYLSAVWSTALRRPFEFISGVIPFLIILALPLLFNLRSVFGWTHKSLYYDNPEHPFESAVLKHSIFRCQDNCGLSCLVAFLSFDHR